MSTDTAPAAMIDRIGAAFGFPGADDAGGDAPMLGETGGEETTGTDVGEQTGDETQQGADLFDFEYGGKQYKLPAELKDAVLKSEDYTRKTQELAEHRRTVEQAREINESAKLEQAFGASIASEQQEIAMIDAYLKEAARLDWSKMSTDQMYRQKIELDAIKDRRDGLAKAVDGKRNKFTQDIQAKIKELRGKAREIASKSITGFGEETERTMRDYAKSEGLTDAEIDNVLLDPRSFKVIWKASQFDKIKADTARAGEQAAQVGKGALRPGVAGRTMPKATADKLNFGKAMQKATTSGQKAQLIESRLAGVFGKGK